MLTGISVDLLSRTSVCFCPLESRILAVQPVKALLNSTFATNNSHKNIHKRSTVYKGNRLSQQKLCSSTMTVNTGTKNVQVVPITFSVRKLGQDINLKENEGHVKVLHFVRHAEGTHNVAKEYSSMDNFDAVLTPFGKEQCSRLALETARLSGVDLLVTSPLTRCVETALLGFPTQVNLGVPFLAHESIRETVNYNCDRRKPIHEVAANFPEVDFSYCVEDSDMVWHHYQKTFGSQEEHAKHRESDDPVHIAARARDFFKWISGRPEKEVLVSTHSAFMHHLFNHAHSGYIENEGFDASLADIISPILEYGDDLSFENSMRDKWGNCELRSFQIIFNHSS